MGKDILRQLTSVRKEIRDLERAIVSAERQIERLKAGEVCDTVTGSREDLTIGPIKVRGHPQKEYGKRLYVLQKKKTFLETKRTELLQMEADAEEYILNITDSSMRRILRYRYIDDLNWQQVANRMEGMYTADGCRMACSRFMGD